MEKTKKSKQKSGDNIFVKVARTGSVVKDVALNGGRTIDDALKAAGVNKKESEIIQVNGEEVDDLTIELEEGDRIVLVKNISGGRV